MIGGPHFAIIVYARTHSQECILKTYDVTKTFQVKRLNDYMYECTSTNSSGITILKHSKRFTIVPHVVDPMPIVLHPLVNS